MIDTEARFAPCVQTPAQRSDLIRRCPMTTGVRIRHAVSPDSIRGASTDDLRARHLVEDLFVAGELNLVYSVEDRLVIGGAVPTSEPLALLPAGPVNTPHF